MVEQRAVISPSPPISATTLLAKSSSDEASNRNSRNSSKKKERPFCTHCNIQGHTVERCYKLHGFPPGYRNQKSSSGKSDTAPAKTSESNNLLSSLNAEECQGLLTLLQTHLAKAKADTSPVGTPGSSSTSHVAVISPSTSLPPDSSVWIVDSGASAHVCFLKESFISLKPISGATLSLPNNMSFTVEFLGDVYLQPDLILKDVLFVPSFHFNLISVSSLITQSPFMVSFIDGSCLIQDKFFLRKIGRANLW